MFELIYLILLLILGAIGLVSLAFCVYAIIDHIRWNNARNHLLRDSHSNKRS